MAEKEIISGVAPFFVHTARPERTYSGPADPVMIWGIARKRVGVEGSCSEQQKQEVRIVYDELCRTLPDIEPLFLTEEIESVMHKALGGVTLSKVKQVS